jgi:hypothetical protein
MKPLAAKAVLFGRITLKARSAPKRAWCCGSGSLAVKRPSKKPYWPQYTQKRWIRQFSLLPRDTLKRAYRHQRPLSDCGRGFIEKPITVETANIRRSMVQRTAMTGNGSALGGRHIPNTCPNNPQLGVCFVALHCLVLPENGAGDGNRTHASSLGSCSSTIELHPLGYALYCGSCRDNNWQSV